MTVTLQGTATQINTYKEPTAYLIKFDGNDIEECWIRSESVTPIPLEQEKNTNEPITLDKLAELEALKKNAVLSENRETDFYFYQAVWDSFDGLALAFRQQAEKLAAVDETLALAESANIDAPFKIKFRKILEMRIADESKIGAALNSELDAGELAQAGLLPLIAHLNRMGSIGTKFTVLNDGINYEVTILRKDTN